MTNKSVNPFLNQAKNKLGTKIQELSTEQSFPKDGKVSIELIEIKKQVRTEFDDAENSIDELAADIKQRGVLQPILLRPIGSKYELVAGERRLRAAKKIGLTDIPANVIAMTDEEAEDAQFAENIHRKNLTLKEEATKIQRDLDALGGDVQALLKKYNKPATGKSWVSKMTSLLKLPEQTKRLMDENISADAEVINTVKQIEKVNPVKAKEVVDDLKKNRKEGQGTARKVAQVAKEEVKPSKRSTATKINAHTDESNNVATPKNRDAEQPGPVSVFPKAGAGVATPSAVPTPSVASTAEPAWVSKILKDETLDADSEKSMQVMEEEAKKYFEIGKKTDSWLNGVLLGLHKFYFSNSFAGRLNLAAFSAGFEKQDSFEIKTLIKLIKNSK